jgi:hypothetical protein
VEVLVVVDVSTLDSLRQAIAEQANAKVNSFLIVVFMIDVF